MDRATPGHGVRPVPGVLSLNVETMASALASGAEGVDTVPLDNDAREDARMRLQIEHLVAENVKLREELAEHKKDVRSVQVKQRRTRSTVRRELERANRTLVILVAALIIAALGSTPEIRAAVVQILQRMVPGK